MGNCSIPELVLAGVAEAEGVGPLELPPLHDSIDADALQSLLTETTSDDHSDAIEVSFRYYGYSVTVTSDGALQVVPE